MNRDDVIRMAREAGLKKEDYWVWHIDPLERFAALVAAAAKAEEREACAKVCEPLAGFVYSPNTLDTMNNCAAAIRARRNT